MEVKGQANTDLINRQTDEIHRMKEADEAWKSDMLKTLTEVRDRTIRIEQRQLDEAQ